MIPDSAAAAISFLLFVAPGLVWETLRERAYPPFGGSVFREGSRAVLASVAFTGLAVLLLVGLRGAWPGSMPDVDAWVREGRRYSDEHYRLIAVAAVIEVALACSLAALAVYVAQRRSRGRTGVNVSEPVAWSVLSGTASGATAEEPSDPRVAVRLKDGSVYVGDFQAIDYQEDANPPMIALQPPVALSRGGARIDVPAPWSRVAIPLEQIQELWIMRVARNAP